MHRNENVAIAERVLDLFTSGGPGAPFDAGLIASDAVWQPAFEVTGGRKYVGREGFERFMREWTEDFDEWTLETLELVGAGDAVAARQRQRAIGKGSGATVELVFGSVLRFREGRVARVEIYLDFSDALEAAVR